MRIRRFTPAPPPPEFTLTFTRAEGWALSMALLEAYGNHPQAVNRDAWKEWASDINRELKRAP